MKRQLTYTRQAVKERRYVPAKVLARIDAALKSYAAEPARARNVKKLKGRDEWRIRVGDWRVIFVDDGETVCVLSIRSRGSAYR